MGQFRVRSRGQQAPVTGDGDVSGDDSTGSHALSVIAIVQARMGSTRLPGKVLEPIGDRPMIEVILSRLSGSKLIDEVVVATGRDDKNRPLVECLRLLGRRVFEGSEDDVLDRYYQAALSLDAATIIRVTGDCPLIDPSIVELVVRTREAKGADYASNIAPPTFPDGLDVEAFSFSALARAWREAEAPSDREHVTPYLRRSPDVSRVNVIASDDYSSRRWTVDCQEDLDVVRSVFSAFRGEYQFSWREVLDLEAARPDLFLGNQNIRRNEGMLVGKGPKLWSRAKRVIPGGGMLLSKRPEMFLPNGWPSYFSRAKGCTVWDLDGVEYVDMTVMGVGTNILGYGQPEVDAAVAQIVASGNMSTLNCPEEVFLAERLVAMHPWADMVRFARTGGEANAISIRIARAAAGRSKVAICGYHGWHDWYLSANLGGDENLEHHLLPGLEPRGVPSSLRGEVLPFGYNRFDELEALVEAHDIGTIKMEVSRTVSPEDGFLEKVRALATARGIVLVFDECTSGFRQSFGGLHLLYGVEPDIAVFGKTLGNGYAVTAVVGRREVMESAQTTFISSTFWTERIGPTAALKALEVMEREQSWNTVTNRGRSIGQRWIDLGAKYDLPFELNGLPALIGFGLRSPDMLKYKTLISQEMLKVGFLASTSVYVCTEHSPQVIDGYFEALEPTIALIGECERGRSVDDLLEGPVCHSGFKRLN
jgi:glutamate-1-semialdehyde 2,1-aminomutase